MDDINISELVGGYKERMRRLILMDPLLHLERKKEVDDEGKEIDMLGLGMLTLLYFFERRLTREYKTSVKDLMDFIQKVTAQQHSLSEAKLERLARTLIQTFRPPSGKKRSYSFYNWESHQDDLIEYSILKSNDFDVITNTQYYTLDEDGLELIFSTKEFYSEYQISINQLLLRQQIQKGEFHGALRQVREMEIDVDTLKERMEKVRLEILRSIVSEETFERYKKLLEDTYLRLEREDEEFKALKRFIAETTDAIYTGDTRRKLEKSYALLLKITKELEAVHYEHGRLLAMTSDLKNTALTTAQESLYYTGISSFNFDKDVVWEILSKPLPPDAVKGVLHPFLKVEENLQWSPMTIFAEQSLIEEQEERMDQVFIETTDQEAEDKYRLWLTEKYGQLMESFLDFYEKKGDTTLKAWMEYIAEKDEELLSKGYFYSLWMLLHQRSPITSDLSRYENTEEKSILGEVLATLSKRQLIVKELPDVIHLHDRYSIQNMSIEIKEDESLDFS